MSKWAMVGWLSPIMSCHQMIINSRDIQSVYMYSRGKQPPLFRETRRQSTAPMESDALVKYNAKSQIWVMFINATTM